MKKETKRRLKNIKNLLRRYAIFEPTGECVIFKDRYKSRQTCDGMWYWDIYPANIYGKVKMIS